MKKFFLALFVIAVLIIGIEYIFYDKGFYMPRTKEGPVATQVQAKEKTLLLQDEKGVYTPWTLKGVDLTSSLPGNQARAFEVDEATYLRWFTWIQEMGANTIRIPYIMDKTFYDAFYKYNQGREVPLYLLQGISITDYANNNQLDGYQKGFYEALLIQARSAVDVIHGNKNIIHEGRLSVERYRKDISSWVLGYVVMVDWNGQTVAYTNHRDYPTNYEGTYVKTSSKATAFEALLARVLDYLITYETDKYHVQRLVSFTNTANTDPFIYEADVAKQLKKHTQIDAQHLVMQPTFKSAYVASYTLYALIDNFYEHFSVEQKEVLEDQVELDVTKLAYDGYTQVLNGYHTMPVVVSYSDSSARGTDTGVVHSEKDQAQRLVKNYQDAIANGMSGVIISSWQDVWGKATWNTAYASLSSKGVYWHDIQSVSQGEGLLSFEPGKEGESFYVDGDASEWLQAKPVMTSEGLSLYVKYDAKGMYLLVQGAALQEGVPIYIPIDTTKQTGSKKMSGSDLTFDKPADFLLIVDGKDNTRLLVQERYSSVRANYSIETTRVDAYVDVPDEDTSKFVPIYMVYDDYTLKAAQEPPFKLYETGKLHYGNGNPKAIDYDSQADFCYGKDGIEIRLPWGLLNFSNPAFMEIHDDYYLNYGVESIPFSKGAIGIGYGKEEVKMAPFELEPWRDKLVYHERLKEAYYRLQEVWNGGKS